MSVFGEKPRRITPKLKLLVYGKPGRGKTYFASFAPKVKILYILTEPQGEATIGIVQRDGGWNAESEYKIVRTLADLDEAMQLIEANARSFHLVVFDTLDDIEEIIGLEVAHAAGGRCISAVDKYGKARDARDTRLQEIVNWLRDLPCHVIALAHLTERIVEHGKDGDKKTDTYIDPRFVGKHAVGVTSQKFNAIGIIDKFRVANGLKYTIRFRGTTFQNLKDLPYFADVEDANIENLLKKHQEFYRVEPTQKGE